MRKIFHGISLSLLISGSVMASNQVVEAAITNAQLVGAAKFEYFFFDVYRAELFAPDGQYQADKHFALALTYLRDFKGVDIAERSVKEMRQQGFNDTSTLSAWNEQMQAIFPDVKKGQTITGVALDGVASFYLNDKPIGQIKDAQFTQRFFDIWLGEKTSEPGLRKQLLKL
ncbi:chalcone isomerase family protein [Alteromonas facilis]|uniref:chalcone isomerase family protein n=1 Tax=Alteromonas facilis TaxID=2048004 RepID=UPI001F0BB3C4|nr:chalcone isomerase family protein [Alteromonas facilis]